MQKKCINRVCHLFTNFFSLKDKKNEKKEIIQKKLYILQNINRIGHLFIEPFMANIFFGGADKFTIGISPSFPVANTFVFNLMDRNYNVIKLDEYNKFVDILDKNESSHVTIGDMEVYRWGNYLFNSYYEHLNQSDFLPFHYQFSPDEKVKGQELQKKLGIPEGASWICLHNREGGYLPSLSYHSYRDANIMNFLPAIRYLVEKGFWVVRIGDPTMVPLPEMKNVIDLPFNEYRTDFADIWLLVHSYFYISASSGPYSAPVTFGSPPMLCINRIDGRAWIHGADDRDTYLFKRLYSKKLKRMLTFSEMCYPGVMSSYAEDYSKNGLEILENSPEDILNAVMEMLENMDKSPEEIQKCSPLNQLLKKQTEKIQRCEDIVGGEILAPFLKRFRMAESFLSAHPDLLGN